MVTALTPTLHLLTYRPEPMLRWWAALLGITHPESAPSRHTTLRGPTFTVVVEHSDIALDYHREACGVTTIAVAVGDVTSAIAVIDRLATVGADPYRATVHPGHVRLWYRDPNGADVGIDIPAGATPHSRSDEPLFPEELDPQVVINRTRERVHQ